jgi:hypothetical protein
MQTTRLTGHAMDTPSTYTDNKLDKKNIEKENNIVISNHNIKTEYVEPKPPYEIMTKIQDIDLGIIKTEENENQNNEFTTTDSNTLVKLERVRKETGSHEVKTSQAVATHLNLENIGSLNYEIEQTQFCKESPHTGWHLKRSSGTMKIKLKSEKIKAKGPLKIRAVLVRENKSIPSLRHRPGM